MPPATSFTGTMPIAEPYQRQAITARGVAALRLAEFEDCWKGLTDEDRRWFAEWLRDLLVDAVLPETA